MTSSHTFSVCMMAREEVAVLDIFLRFYLKAGAERIYLFLDGPHPDFSNPDPDRVKVAQVAEAIEEATGAPPQSEDLNEKQRLCYDIGFRDCASPWMLFVDADEFLTGPDSIEAMLSHIPADTEAFFVQPAEAVWGPGDDLDEIFGCSYFRLPMIRWREKLTPLLYGAHAPLFRRGLLGHSAGKGFVRRGTQVEYLGSHRPVRDGQSFGLPARAIHPALKEYVLAHYDAISFPRWCEKWQIRIDGTITASGMKGPRVVQMRQIGEAFAKGEAASKAMFVRFYGVSWLQVLFLKGLRRMLRMRPLKR